MTTTAGFIIFGRGLVRRGRMAPPPISRPPFGGEMKKRLARRNGQHMFEFALLIGMVTIAALVMQLFARQGVQTGLKIVSDVILDPPPPPDPEDDSEVNVQATSTVTETGDSSFRRVTTLDENVTGNSINEDTRLQFMKDVN